MTWQKEHNNFQATDPKELELCELPEKEFKIIILRKLSENQENTNQWTQETNAWII